MTGVEGGAVVAPGRSQGGEGEDGNRGLHDDDKGRGKKGQRGKGNNIMVVLVVCLGGSRKETECIETGVSVKVVRNSK